MKTTVPNLIELLERKAASTTFQGEREALLAKVAEMRLGLWADQEFLAAMARAYKTSAKTALTRCAAWMVLPEGMYAVADPDAPATWTFWRRGTPLSDPPRPGPGEPVCSASGTGPSVGYRWRMEPWQCERPVHQDSALCKNHLQQERQGKPFKRIQERKGHHAFDAWPTGTRYGPFAVRYARKDVPAGKNARNAFWKSVAEQREKWLVQVVLAIAEDPELAHLRFAAMKAKCFCCGTPLTDPLSKTLGIGPVCREGSHAERLEHYAQRMGEMQGRLNIGPAGELRAPRP